MHRDIMVRAIWHYSWTPIENNHNPLFCEFKVLKMTEIILWAVSEIIKENFNA